MTTTESSCLVSTSNSDSRLKLIEEACEKIAPVWPLNQFIAVNPWWKMVDQHPERISATIRTLRNGSGIMSRSYFRNAWQTGRIKETHLLEVLQLLDSCYSLEEMIQHLDSSTDFERILLMPEFLDGLWNVEKHTRWTDEVVHEISQFSGSYFDRGQSRWEKLREGSFFQEWRSNIQYEKGISMLMEAPEIRELVRALPSDTEELFEVFFSDLGLSDSSLPHYLHALLLSVNGWASWGAYLSWMATLDQKKDSHIRELLAIRVAWEWMLIQLARTRNIELSHLENWATADSLICENEQKNEKDWIWQNALERACQLDLLQHLKPKLRIADGSVSVQNKPQWISCFCIDVRSEVFRRALESVDPSVETRGFAGFFGMPIEYIEPGAEQARPQLPGLTKAKYTVSQTESKCCHSHLNQSLERKNRRKWMKNEVIDSFDSSSSSIFPSVEAKGFFSLSKLIEDGWYKLTPKRKSTNGLNTAPTVESQTTFQIRWTGPQSKSDELLDLVRDILTNMGFKGEADFPAWVFLIGHGSETENNPHQAGLDCGACCGQTGEVNARTLAHLLNDHELRIALRKRGLSIPEKTLFVAGLHNTTTDVVTLFDTKNIPADRQLELDEIRIKLAEAGRKARIERSDRLGVHGQNKAALDQLILQRSKDWSQTRPEWGLANNSSFIVGPRQLTKGIRLHGRTFLHEYDWKSDGDGSVLEQIMTAPLIVTHWINLQYYASTVDNSLYGSGNKLLHNVVGGTLGVFEGNGGDLRIGLPLQSLHNGNEWMHEPVRLNAFLNAPKEQIDTILKRHSMLQHLCRNHWIYLFSIDPNEHKIFRWHEESHWIEES